MSLAVHMPVWPHWWSTSIQVQILPITISMIAGVYQVQSCCQSTYFMLHHLFQWFYCYVSVLHTGPSLPDLLLAWPQHQGRELCVQHLLNMAWCDGTYFSHQQLECHTPPGSGPPPDHLLATCAFSSNPGPFSAVQWLPHHLFVHVLFVISVWC